MCYDTRIIKEKSMQTFLNETEDMDWLWSTHLKPFNTLRLDFKSVMLYGNEDCPTRIELFPVKMPKFDAIPGKVFLLQENGSYRKTK